MTIKCQPYTRDIRHPGHLCAGYSHLQLLITVLIIGVGVLGMSAMQLSARQVAYDGLQRSIATLLVQDIIERIRSNPAALPEYVVDNMAASATAPFPDCIVADCTSVELARHDLWEWGQALQDASSAVSAVKLSGLDSPRACIAVSGNILTVTVVWKGLMDTGKVVTTCGNGLGLYGKVDSRRQMVSFSTVVMR